MLLATSLVSPQCLPLGLLYFIWLQINRGSALTALLCAACSVQGSSFLGIESSYYILAFAASLGKTELVTLLLSSI
jgi:hypothetical protein